MNAINESKIDNLFKRMNDTREKRIRTTATDKLSFYKYYEEILQMIEMPLWK